MVMLIMYYRMSTNKSKQHMSKKYIEYNKYFFIHKNYIKFHLIQEQ